MDCGVELKKQQSKRCPYCASQAQRRAIRPSSDELVKLIAENGFEKVGRMFNVSGKTIAKWCKAYNLPTHKKDVIQWYKNTINL